MQILLDGTPCPTTAHSIGEAINAAAAIAKDNGRCVIEVSVDGQPISSAQLDAEGRLDSTAEVIQFITAPPNEVVRDTWYQAVESLDQIDRLNQEAAEYIQVDQLVEGMKLLNEAIAVWLTVQEATINGAALTGLDLNTVSVAGGTLHEAIAELNARLTQTVDSLKNNDVIALADTLLYEMPEVILTWKHVLSELADGLE